MIIFKKKTDAEIAATPAKVAPAPAESGSFTPVPKAESKGKKGKKTADDDTLL
ncbi:MAG: hypothetical protein RIR97_1182 [Pseudomonadota bacterium]|jgi:hypothetical protein